MRETTISKEVMHAQSHFLSPRPVTADANRLT
jgi:hypothetical protein